MEQLNPVQGNSKKVIYKFRVALFEFRNILECAQLISFSYFWFITNPASNLNQETSIWDTS